MALPDREAAKEWILRHQSGRRNLTPEGLAYLRGKRFQVEKGRQGGTGANQYSTKEGNGEQRGQSDTAARKTSWRLAEEFKVSARTITRDAKFAEAVDVLATDGEEVKRLVLSRDARITRWQVMRLAEMRNEPRRDVVKSVVETGMIPKTGGKQRPKAKVLLQRKPKEFAAGVVSLLGLRCARAIREALAAAIREKDGLSKKGESFNQNM